MSSWAIRNAAPILAKRMITVNKKVLAAQKHGLTPIVCVGETLAEYEAGKTAEVVRRQTLEGLKGLDAAFAPKIVVAYEPVWAIGTGRASSAENAEAVHRDGPRGVEGSVRR